MAGCCSPKRQSPCLRPFVLLVSVERRRGMKTGESAVQCASSRDSMARGLWLCRVWDFETSSVRVVWESQPACHCRGVLYVTGAGVSVSHECRKCLVDGVTRGYRIQPDACHVVEFSLLRWSSAPAVHMWQGNSHARTAMPYSRHQSTDVYTVYS